MEILLTLLLDLLITASAYLFFPAIFCLGKTQLTLSQIKKLVIVNGICVCIIFNIIRISNGVDGGVAGLPVWSFVAYWLMKKRCLQTEEKHETIHEQKYSVTPIQTDKKSLSLETKGNTKNDDIADIVIRLLNDEEFLSAVKKISDLDKDKLSSLLRFL